MGSLASVSDDELVTGLNALETQQRSTMAVIIEHLVEMERRRLHLRLGYSSLCEYCLKVLRLSEDEAYRRMTCSRLAARQPEIVLLLARGELSLTTATMLKPLRPTTNPPAPARPCLSSAPARKVGPQKRARPAIPRATVRATYQRDQERCSFVAPDGRRCEQRHFLEIDHRIPWSRTRNHTTENLRVLCRAHNQLLAPAQPARSRP
ncbi:MAG TPA: HNH endonuclease signature motif containing protein [Polyangiaceae bacterium]|nr:HNH endonuclease signature motif containing protein [Polyangiaceae bacterium]